MKWPQVFMIVWFAFNVFMAFGKSQKMAEQNQRGDGLIVLVGALALTALLVWVLYCGGFWS